MDYTKGRQEPEAQSASSLERGLDYRCREDGMNGRCQLRGTVGSFGAGYSYAHCSWHAARGSRNTFREFCEFIAAEKEQGATRWDHRTAGEWWDLVQGTPGPGGATSAGTPGKSVTEIQGARSVAEAMAEIAGRPDAFLKGLTIQEGVQMEIAAARIGVIK